MAAGISQVAAAGVAYSLEEIQEWFDAGFYYPQPIFGEYMDEIPMGDHAGKELKVAEQDPVPAPVELSSDSPGRDIRLGHRVGKIKPRTYGLGYQITYEDERDSQVDEPAWAVQGVGQRMAYWPEKTFFTLVFDPATATFTGNDDQPLFSATHDYRVSAEIPGITAATTATTRSNIHTGIKATGATAAGSDWYLGLITPQMRKNFYVLNRQDVEQGYEDHNADRWKEWVWTRRFGVGYRYWQNWLAIQNTKLYTDASEVISDFYTAMVLIKSQLDPHGERVNIAPPGSQWVVVRPDTAHATTLEFIDEAFEPKALASEASNRPALRFNAKIIDVPWLTAA